MKKQEPITIYLNKMGMLPLWKGQVIVRSTDGHDYPIAFIKKAKGASNEEYWQILNHLFRPQ